MSDKPRPFDHLVLPVSELALARERLTRLGFTVAPDGMHPFGTANCCVFFDDGAFLEPLAVAGSKLAREQSEAGNVFTRHDRAYRARIGEEGLSAVVYGTADAEADHARFVEAGISAGDILNFTRDFETPDGGRDRAAFRLAFAKSPDAPDCLIFTCQRVAVPNLDRSALQRHPNGITGIARVLMTAPDPSGFAGFIDGVTDASARTVRGGVALRSGGFDLAVLTPEAFSAETGLPAPAADAPRFRAIGFACADRAHVAARLDAAGIAHRSAPIGLVVSPEPGQGAAFIFLSQEAV